MSDGDGSFAPRARQEGLIASDLGDEVLVYDLGPHHAHSLNRAATLVWQACNGENTVAEIAHRVSSELGETMSTETAWLAVRLLGESGLLLDVVPVSRHSEIRALSADAPAFPAISHIVAPALAAHRS